MSLDGVLTQWHSSKQGNEVVIVNFSLGNMFFICRLEGLFSRYTKSKGSYNHMITRFFYSIHFLFSSKSKQTHQNIVFTTAGVVTLSNKVMRIGSDTFCNPFIQNIFTKL